MFSKNELFYFAALGLVDKKRLRPRPSFAKALKRRRLLAGGLRGQQPGAGLFHRGPLSGREKIFGVGKQTNEVGKKCCPKILQVIVCRTFLRPRCFERRSSLKVKL